MVFKSKNKKKIVILMIIAVLLLILLIPIKKYNLIGKLQERFSTTEESDGISFTYEVIEKTINGYKYNYNIIITVKGTNGLETITYPGKEEEIVLDCKNKTIVGIDFEAEEDIKYEFNIKTSDQVERTEVIELGRQRIGKDTYKLINGTYVNTPYLEEGFNEKYTRYMYLNDNGNLVPGNWIYDEEPENWYDYSTQNWANIYVESEGSEAYYVWIPRYMYKVDSENSRRGNERTDVKFVDVYNNYMDKDGNVTKFEELLAQGYQLPEAFQWGDSNDIELSGYWMSKYQLSELGSYKLNYNLAASIGKFEVRDFTNNTTGAVSYTYAINGEIKNTSKTLDDYTFTDLEDTKSYSINVTALDKNGEIVGSMTKIFEITEANPPELDGFDSDTTFYVYWDDDGIEHNEIPISQPAPENWYNYSYSQWANIVTRNNGLETYYVWIPRYQYKLNSTSQRADIKFIEGTGTTTDAGYKIPEAFSWGDDLSTQLTGYWITKYQLSREESTPRITAELAAGSSIIRVRDITGTLITGDLTYYYYLNGELKHTGTSATENYIYTGLEMNTTYAINIVARNTDTNEYVGAITQKVTTIEPNAPDISTFKENETLKNTTYYVVYDDDGNETLVPITEEVPENWYDYSNAKWANIVVKNSTATTYLTWIPRYEYRILSSINDWSNIDKSNVRTDVNFLKGTSTETSTGYKIPEAFSWGNDLSTQLTGYWITKYQLSN